jgi:carboxyl-terminal processing protease
MKTNRKNIENNYKNYNDFRDKFSVNDNMLNELLDIAKNKNIEFKSDGYNRDLDFIKVSIKSQIARDIWGNEGSYAVFMSTDNQFLKAITLFDEAMKVMR